MLRKLQNNSNLIISLPLIKKDGSQANGLELSTLFTTIISPSGSALIGYDEAIFTEPNSDGIYTCTFPTTATNKAFTLEDQANPYILTLDSSTIDVEPTSIEIWISSLYPWEFALETSVQAINDYLTGESSPISKLIVQPVQGNFSYATIKKQEVDIKKGDSPSITYNLDSNISAYTVWFAAKETYDSTTEAISSREITNSVSDSTNGIGTIPLTTQDTDIEVGDYIGELQLRSGLTIITPSEFKIKILNSIF